MIATDVRGVGARHANIKLSTTILPPLLSKNQHDNLLGYLQERLDSDKTNRDMRTRRYATIDKSVSTWQQLTPEDTQRKGKQEATGKAQAININLPIQHTHMDDMVSFFCGVYAPNAGAFYEEPNDDTNDTESRLKAIKVMNGDAKKNKYFKHLMRAMRSLFKYNIGGFLVEWLPLSDTEDMEGSNHISHIDMYNFMWDPSVDDPSEIPTKAEWSAIASRENRMTLVKREKNGEYFGVGAVLHSAKTETTNGAVATYYKYPPNHAGLTADGADSPAVKGGRADWASYGVGLAGEDGAVTLENTHEIVQMYCWLRAADFGLNPPQASVDKESYTLFKFVIMDNKRIVQISLVQLDDENPQEKFPPRIPMFVGFLNQDDMGVAQRSVAELLQPFQSYGSFLLNAHVSGTRSAIWGLQAYDPEMFDMKSIPEGAETARVPSKKPGRDVRSGLMTVNGNPNTGQAMDDLSKLMALIDKFFPGQSMPSQIAGIDRAVQSQVAAVLQGVNRRLHMLVRVIDDDILGPTRFEQVINMIRNGKDEFSGMTESEIMNFIGSGLAQLNREVASQAMQQILFAIIQNPNASQEFDVLGLMEYWGRMMNMDANLQKYRLNKPAAGAPGQVPPTAVPPIA